MTITHGAFDLTVQGPPGPGPTPPRHGIWDTLLVTSGDHHWRPVQACSLLDISTGTDIWWPPKQVRLVRWGYASYWNAFLLIRLLAFERFQDLWFPLQINVRCI